MLFFWPFFPPYILQRLQLDPGGILVGRHDAQHPAYAAEMIVLGKLQYGVARIVRV
jgi:hypothetical protein